jgi:starvation-inducible DNA-binding protein
MNNLNINHLLNQYVADSLLFVVKLHSIHWNIVGRHFMKIHDFTEELYTRFFKTYDDFAEVLKIKGEPVYGSVNDYLKVGTIKELRIESITEEESLRVIMEDLDMLNLTAKTLRDLGHAEGDVSCTMLAEAEVQFLEKQLWFIKAMLKK